MDNSNIFNSYSSEEYIPVDLYDAIEYLNCILSKKNKRKIVQYFETDKIIFWGYDFGKSIRNDWGLWRGENDLVIFFNSYGIFHPDEMSSIILTSFYRKMKNQEIDFEGQVKKFLDDLIIWKEHENNESKRALEAYSKYQECDLITIYMEMDLWIFNNIDNVGASVIISPGYEWTFNPEKDLELKGKILEKEIIEDSTNVNLLIKVLDFNKKGMVKIYSEDTKVGDTIEITLKYLRYE